MLINSIDLKDKTVFHEVNLPENFNSFSVMDYPTVKMGKHQKVNNGITHILDFCAINDNQILLCYVPRVVDKIICKVLTIEGTYITTGPMYSLDEFTNTNKISICNITKDKFIICYNDNSNKCCKAIVISVAGDKITTISSTILMEGIIPEICLIKTTDCELVLFFQYQKSGKVKLIKLVDGNKLVEIEEQTFYMGSDLWNLTIKQVQNYYVVGFINSDHKLMIKILEVEPKVHFTHGLQYNIKIEGDYFQMISIDNEMVLCYFNNIVQIISLNNGQIIQPENMG